MAVVVDHEPIDRLFRRLGVLVHLRAEGEPGTLFDEFVEACRQRLESADHPRVGCSQPGFAVDGPVVRVAAAFRRALHEFLNGVADTLSGRGVTGTLGAYTGPEVPWARLKDWTSCVSGGLVFTIAGADSDPVLRTRSWSVSPESTLSIVDRCIEWCGAVGGPVHFEHAAVSSEVRREDLQSLMTAALARTSAVGLRMGGANRFRRVVFDAYGHVVLEDVGTAAYTDTVASLTGMIRAYSSLLRYAVIKVDAAPRPGWEYFIGYGTPVGTGTYFQRLLAEEGEYVPDAYAVQLLTEPQLQRTDGLRGWSIEEVADHRYLVQAASPDDWFRTGGPAASTLTMARKQFGSAILTREILKSGQTRRRPG